MNKIEQAVLIGVKDALDSVTVHEEGDDYEAWAKRMQTTLKSNVKILSRLVKLEPTEDKEEGLSL